MATHGYGASLAINPVGGSSAGVMSDCYSQTPHPHQSHSQSQTQPDPLLEVTNVACEPDKEARGHQSYFHHPSQNGHTTHYTPNQHSPSENVHSHHLHSDLQSHSSHSSHSHSQLAYAHHLQSYQRIPPHPAPTPAPPSELAFSSPHVHGCCDFCASSDPNHSPRALPRSHRSHTLASSDSLSHRAILSTPTSSHTTTTHPDHDNPHSLARILGMPYALGSPDMHTSEPQPMHMSLPQLGHGYLGPGHASSRKFAPRVLANAYDSYHTHCEYPISASLPPSAGPLRPTYEFIPRISSSPPSGVYRQMPPRHFGSPANLSSNSDAGVRVGQKRKPLLSAYVPHEGPRKLKRQALALPSPRIVAVPHAKESGHQRITTVLCLHASVAQKSYGQEKRFLCPPPLVRITGPYRRLSKQNRPVLSMSILNDEGNPHLTQTAYLTEDDTNVHFKSLHISGAAKKAKHVSLQLSFHPPPSSASATQTVGPDFNELTRPFATFESDNCAIISKPSKKTAKARNTQSCIFNGSTICLFNRINSQTVRTKYLCVEGDQLAARASQWSAFTINVVRRAEDAGHNGSPGLATKTLLSSSIPGADRTVTYGSEVELIDFVTGVSSGPLWVRKVEKTKVQKDATGPISQMQKLAFCKVDPVDGSAIYVSALESGRFPSPEESNGLGSPFEVGTDPHGVSFTPHQPFPMSFHGLQYQTPRAVLPPEEQGGMTLDEIDDSVAWTVIGVSHFSHTFFDLSPDYPQIPHDPITPLPVIVSSPKVDLEALKLTMSLKGYFDSQIRPMEIWLGPVGPLLVTVLNTTGITLAASAEEEASGLELQLSSHNRQETQVMLSLPTLETIHWTLHGREMAQGAVVILDESKRSIGELIGRREASSMENAIPTLPITLIRCDGISFVLAHSVCLVESEEARRVDGSGPIYILKVI